MGPWLGWIQFLDFQGENLVDRNHNIDRDEGQ